MGSEAGVQSFKPEEIKEKGRLKPGKMLLVDTFEGVDSIMTRSLKPNLPEISRTGNGSRRIW